jgi:hypothetical protein
MYPGKFTSNARFSPGASSTMTEFMPTCLPLRKNLAPETAARTRTEMVPLFAGSALAPGGGSAALALGAGSAALALGAGSAALALGAGSAALVAGAVSGAATEGGAVGTEAVVAEGVGVGVLWRTADGFAALAVASL